jgi:hypothetical protein
MATTTTNFGWDIPQSTDLVKDGATAIAALGQDIDTALVDLKGGTTGQVLAKASGTDLDFSWVAVDPLTILDAKGDLISATAADTPARLAVGTNGQVLTADSTVATGLKWATPSSGITYSTWTPTLTNLTVGNGTAIWSYAQSGKVVFIDISFTLGSTSSVGDVRISLPVEAKYNFGSFLVNYLDAGTTYFAGAAVIENDGTSFISTKVFKTDSTYATLASLSSTVPMTWTTNDRISIQGSYEAV